MPSPGNHENELGNGPIGYRAYQTYFSVPQASGQTDVTRGLWYAFTAGSVRVVSIANDDVCYQDGGDSYVRGYSNGAQKAWLEAELAAARSSPGVDWIVVCMHQVAISTGERSNGADLGVREDWLPLFDRHGVDLVVCGHEHHYERSHPIRGREANPTLTPRPAATDIRVIDTTKGTVHMVIGGGGTSAPSNGALFDPPRCRVITGASAPNAAGRRAADLCHRGRAVVGGAEPGPRLRLRRLHRRSRRPRRVHRDRGHLLRCRRRGRGNLTLRNLQAPPPAPGLIALPQWFLKWWIVPSILVIVTSMFSW